jgi:hypothetical protein
MLHVVTTRGLSWSNVWTLAFLSCKKCFYESFLCGNFIHVSVIEKNSTMFLMKRNNTVIGNECESYMVVNVFGNIFLEKNVYE